MENFATRSALVAVWVSLGAFGIILLATGCINIWGSFFLSEQVGNSFNISKSLGVLGIALFLIGGTIILFCGKQIYKSVTRPMMSGKNARAETPILRALSVLAFTAGTIIGVYGLYKQGTPMIADISEIMSIETTQAKIVSFSSELGADGSKSGIFAYYAGNPPKKLRGQFEGKFANLTVKPGYTFKITYNKKNPSKYYLNRPKPKLAYFLPNILGLLIIFWMVAAGITGVFANLGNNTNTSNSNGNIPNSPSYRNNNSRNNSFGTFSGHK